MSLFLVHEKTLFIRSDPLYSLKPLDIEVMKRLGTRVNLIPVIAKADTLTQDDLRVFKERVCTFNNVYVALERAAIMTFAQIRAVIAAQNIRIYQPPMEEDDPATMEHSTMLSNAMPFSIIGSTEDVKTPDGRTVKGREYQWGVAEGETYEIYSLYCSCDRILRYSRE